MMKIVKNITIVAFVLAVLPLSCQAFGFEDLFEDLKDIFFNTTSSSQVITEIEVSANTGQTTINGEVKEGETKIEIEVEEIINGTEIEPIEIETEAGEVRVESEITTDEGTAQVHREIEIDSATTEEDYEVDLEEELSDIGGCKVAEECLETEDETNPVRELYLTEIQNWWDNFLASLTSFFDSIFSIF